MKLLWSALGFTFLTTPAFAHLPSGKYESFAAGFFHPLLGLDHILAMVAVGVWASFLGNRAIWSVPLAFVVAMLVGFVIALSNVPLPIVEPMILASTVIFGIVIAAALRFDLWLCATLVSLFAVFHGHAHGGELGEASALRFGLGFAIATALLHGSGIAFGVFFSQCGRRFGKSGEFITRGLGAATGVAGLALAFS